MSEALEAIVKLLALGAAIAILTWLARAAAAPARRRRVVIGLAVLGGLGYVNFGRFHTDGSPLHVWDQFHYVLGSKYYPELGYDGLYAATLAARAEAQPDLRPPPRVRDLRTGEVVPTLPAPFVAEVHGRFSPARWSEFRDDATRFLLRDDLFLDHGYLPTPARTAVERLFTSHLGFRTRTVALYATLDFLLLALAGFAIHRAFGLEALAAAALLFGLGYCSRYYWVGGAFLRQDWLALLIVAAAALRLGRAGLAGAALAYAAWARVFPGLALLPLGLFALARWRAGQSSDGQNRRFALAFGVGSLVMLAAGCLAGRGAAAWLDWFGQISRHGGTIVPNAIGLRVPLSASLANLRGDLVDPQSLYDYARVAADFAQRGHARWPLVAVAVILLSALALRRAWRAPDPATALAAAVGLIYALFTPTCYYGSFFVLLVLVRPLSRARLLLALNAGMYLAAGAVFALSRHGLLRLNGAAVYVPVSLLLLVGLVEFLVRDDPPRLDSPAQLS
jgi:hypothetical protein